MPGNTMFPSIFKSGAEGNRTLLQTLKSLINTWINISYSPFDDTLTLNVNHIHSNHLLLLKNMYILIICDCDIRMSH